MDCQIYLVAIEQYLARNNWALAFLTVVCVKGLLTYEIDNLG